MAARELPEGRRGEASQACSEGFRAPSRKPSYLLSWGLERTNRSFIVPYRYRLPLSGSAPARGTLTSPMLGLQATQLLVI